MPLIFRAPFLTMPRADIRCSDASITLRAGKFKVGFIKTLRFPRKVGKMKRNGLNPMILTNHVNRRILEWEERIEKVDIAEAENASLRAMIKTTKAIEKITHNRERQVRIKMK
ncbi:hypothetical protein Tco_0497952 [Tanacetum coccineum]